MNDKSVIRILLLGKSGVGKSSFINYFIGQDVAHVANGEPCTQELNKYVLNEWENCAIEVYDSKGLEVLDADAWCDNILKEIKNRNDGDIFDWFHTIFYCISATKKIEDYEFKLLNDIKNVSKQCVHIIETNCDGATEGQLYEREQVLREHLGTDTCIYRIISVNMIKRNGQVVEQSGRQGIIDNIFKLFWKDISKRISNDVGTDIKKGLRDIVFTVGGDVESFINNNTGVVKLCKYLYYSIRSDEGYDVPEKDNMDYIMDNFFNAADQRFNVLHDSIAKELNNKLSDANKLYCSYSSVVDKCLMIDGTDILDDYLDDVILSDRFDFLNEDDFIQKLSIGKIEKIMKELEDIDDDNAFGMLKTLGKAIGTGVVGIIKLKKDLLHILYSTIADILNDMDNTDFKKDLYEKLISLTNN